MSQIDTINKDACWLYAGSVTSDDYGLVGSEYAHRLMYRITFGDIPHKHQIDHLCFVPRCINPNHLEAVTELENIRRSWANRRSATHCPNNHLYTGNNLLIDNVTKARRCLTCRREQSKRAGDKRKLKKLGAS
jgi:hypothetical protein